MTISLKKVTAGSGYDYLIRQVAAQDSTVRTGLAAYYEEKGEAPGVWMGSGLDSWSQPSASISGGEGGRRAVPNQVRAGVLGLASARA